MEAVRGTRRLESSGPHSAKPKGCRPQPFANEAVGRRNRRREEKVIGSTPSSRDSGSANSGARGTPRRPLAASERSTLDDPALHSREPDVGAQRHLDRSARLTPRETAVLRWMAHGDTNSGIARRLFVSTKTVEAHVGCIFEKLDIHEQWGTNRRVLAVIRWLNQEADFARAPERPCISSARHDPVSK